MISSVKITFLRFKMLEELRQKNLRFGKRMIPYVDRARLKLWHFDFTDPEAKNRLEDSQTEMTNILKKKKIPPHKTKLAVDQTLDFAVDHQLERLRRGRYLEYRAVGERDLARLEKHIDRLVQVL